MSILVFLITTSQIKSFVFDFGANQKYLSNVLHFKAKTSLSKTSYIQQLQFHNIIHNYVCNFNYVYSVNVKLGQLYMDMHDEKFPSNLKKENKKIAQGLFNSSSYTCFYATAF